MLVNLLCMVPKVKREGRIGGKMSCAQEAALANFYLGMLLIGNARLLMLLLINNASFGSARAPRPVTRRTKLRRGFDRKTCLLSGCFVVSCIHGAFSKCLGRTTSMCVSHNH